MHVYYHGAISRAWVSGDDRCGVIFDIVQDGQVLAQSNGSVKCCKHEGFTMLGHVGYLAYFLQQYDSRAAQEGFEKTSFDDRAWEQAGICQHAEYRLYPQPTQPLDIYEIEPIKVERTGDVYRADFGRVYVGYLSLRGKGEAGSKVIIRCGQELKEDGSVRYQMRSYATYEEAWILADGKSERRDYDYKSFQYVELQCPTDCEIENICLTVRHYPYKEIRSCAYPEPELQKIWRFAADSLHYGVQDIIQDCMDRERGQYLCDGLFSASALAAVTGDTAMLERVLTDTFRTSVVTRSLLCIAPCSFMQESSDYSLRMPGFVLLQSWLSGSLEFAEGCYDALADMVDYFKERFAGEDGLLRDVDTKCFLDWPPNMRDNYDFEITPSGTPARGLHNVINAHYVGAVKTMNCLAAKLDRPVYGDAEGLEKAFIKAFYMEDKGYFRDAEGTDHVSLPGNAYPLSYDICPNRETQERIIRLMREKDVTLTHSYTAFACLSVLMRLGRTEELKKFVLHEGRWRRMLREGATAMFEAWGKDLKVNTSLFHLTNTLVNLFITDWGQETFFKELYM